MRGRGSKTGNPTMAVMHGLPCVLPLHNRCQIVSRPLLEKLHQMDEATPQLGLRAFVWNIEQAI